MWQHLCGRFGFSKTTAGVIFSETDSCCTLRVIDTDTSYPLRVIRHLLARVISRDTDTCCALRVIYHRLAKVDSSNTDTCYASSVIDTCYLLRVVRHHFLKVIPSDTDTCSRYASSLSTPTLRHSSSLDESNFERHYPLRVFRFLIPEWVFFNFWVLIFFFFL